MIKNMVLFLCLGYTTPFFATPAVVIMIRHGEKEIMRNSFCKKVYVKNKKGKQEPIYTPYLSVKGHERANALVPYFVMDSQNTIFGQPVAIFASGPAKAGGSMRPIDTILPTVKAFGLEVQAQYTAEEYKDLAEHIMTNKEFDGKYIIISFEHHHIPLLAHAMGVKQAPHSWPEVFDRAWVTKFDKHGKVLSFENKPQRLLYGDSKR